MNDALNLEDPDGHTQILPALSPFSFCNQDELPWRVRLPTTAEWLEVPKCNPRVTYHEWGQILQQDWDHSQRWQDLWATLPPSLSPLPDHRFESDCSSGSTSSSVSSRSNRSGGSRHSNCSWQHFKESEGHMKINLPVFKDEDMKDAMTYQSWCWDLMVYHHTGCWDHTLLPYAINSLQGYPGELIRSLGTDITLDGILIILDEHYNNVKALGGLWAVNGWERDSVRLGVCLSRHLQILVASFPECFPPDHIAELKHDCFYGGLPKQFKGQHWWDDVLWLSPCGTRGWEGRGNGTISWPDCRQHNQA